MAEALAARKVFVGGLSAQTTRETLIAHFQNYGVIQECSLMVDRNTGRSRCFCFVTMRDKEAADHILSEEQVVDGKKVDCKKAVPKDSAQTSEATADFSTRKLFVGGLPPEVTLEEFREYFQQFGELEDSVVMYDRETGRPRGFGFVTFTEHKAVDEVLANYNNNLLKGKWVECKKAMPKDVPPPSKPFYANSEPFYPSYSPQFFPPQGYLEPGFLEYPYGGEEGEVENQYISQSVVNSVLGGTEDTTEK